MCQDSGRMSTARGTVMVIRIGSSWSTTSGHRSAGSTAVELLAHEIATFQFPERLGIMTEFPLSPLVVVPMTVVDGGVVT